MSKYPVETSDLDGVIAGVNYLLSGPGGSGQNFDGNSKQFTAYFTGNNLPPYAGDVGSSLSVPPITLASSEMLDAITFKFTFSSTQTDPPFVIGNPITVEGVSDNTYNQIFYSIGVIECTTDYVIARSDVPYTLVSPGTGGDVFYNKITNVFTGYDPGPVYLDVTARATVTGASDRVFLSAQVEFFPNLVNSGGTDSSVKITTSIEKATLVNMGSLQNPTYIPQNSNPFYAFEIYVSVPAGGAYNDGLSYYFVNILETTEFFGPVTYPGYYEYRLSVRFDSEDSNISLQDFRADSRSLTCQVVKQ